MASSCSPKSNSPETSLLKRTVGMASNGTTSEMRDALCRMKIYRLMITAICSSTKTTLFLWSCALYEPTVPFRYKPLLRGRYRSSRSQSIPKGHTTACNSLDQYLIETGSPEKRLNSDQTSPGLLVVRRATPVWHSVVPSPLVHREPGEP